MIARSPQTSETEGRPLIRRGVPERLRRAVHSAEPAGNTTDDDSDVGYTHVAQSSSAGQWAQRQLGFLPEHLKLRLWREAGADHNRIQVDPSVMGGVPVIVGTRIPVYVILGRAAAGYNAQQIVEELGGEITVADVHEAFAFASTLAW